MLQANGASAMLAMPVRVMILVVLGGTARRTKGEFQLVRAIDSPMDQAFFFECPQGAVEGNAVGVAKSVLQVALGNRIVSLKEDFQHLFPDGRPPQGMRF